MGAYLLWYHWFIVRTGLVLGRGQAAFLVVITGVVMALFTAGPFLLDYAFTGSFGSAAGVEERKGCFLKKAAQKLLEIWACGAETPQAQISKVFLLLFVYKK